MGSNRLQTICMQCLVKLYDEAGNRCSATAKRWNCIQVIIVPIFWNKKVDEKETVISAAQQVLQQLQELGMDVGLDDTNADAPGQKYRYW